MSFKTLKVKFILYIIPLIALVSSSFLFFLISRTDYLFKQKLTELGFALVTDLSHSSELAAIFGDENLLLPYLDEILKHDEVISATVYNKKGEIVISRKKTEIEEKISQETTEELIGKKEALKKVSYTQEKEEVYSFYSPVFARKTLAFASGETGKLSGFAGINISLEKIRTQNIMMLWLGLEITVLLILISIGLTFFFAGRIIKPIKHLIKGTEIIGQGDFTYEIKIKSGDETEILANSFNQMAKKMQQSRQTLEEERLSLEIRIKARTRELRELAESLEQKVRERTRQLEERIKELERFRKLTTGRELRMVELKKEIKKLQKELEKSKG